MKPRIAPNLVFSRVKSFVSSGKTTGSIIVNKGDSLTIDIWRLSKLLEASKYNAVTKEVLRVSLPSATLAVGATASTLIAVVLASWLSVRLSTRPNESTRALMIPIISGISGLGFLVYPFYR